MSYFHFLSLHLQFLIPMNLNKLFCAQLSYFLIKFPLLLVPDFSFFYLPACNLFLKWVGSLFPFKKRKWLIGNAFYFYKEAFLVFGCGRVLKLADGVSSETPTLVLDPRNRIQLCILFIAHHTVARMTNKGCQIKMQHTLLKWDFRKTRSTFLV